MLSEIWDWILEKLGEGWEALKEAPQNVWEFVSGAFGSLDEFSAGGLAMAFLAGAVLWMSRKNVFKAFDLFPTGQKLFWVGITMIGSIVMAYIMGKRAFDS